jgi:error-prone DNA polymerase
LGVARPEELVEAAARMRMDALALTDRDGMYGVPRFLEAAEKACVSSAVGVEVSMEEGGHLVLLAEGIEGYRSLCRLITLYRCSSEDRRKPRCSLETLSEHGGGTICLTGAVPFGLLPRLVLSGQGRRAEEVLGVLREAFGREGVFVELSDDETAGSRKRLARVAAFAREAGAQTIAAGEVTYLRAQDHRLHEVLVAASHLCSLPGPGYRPTDQLYLKPPGKVR